MIKTNEMEDALRVFKSNSSIVVVKAKEGDKKTIFGRPMIYSGGKWKPSSGGSSKEGYGPSTKMIETTREHKPGSGGSSTPKDKPFIPQKAPEKKPKELSDDDVNDILQTHKQLEHGATITQHGDGRHFIDSAEGKYQIPDHHIDAMKKEGMLKEGNDIFGNKKYSYAPVDIQDEGTSGQKKPRLPFMIPGSTGHYLDPNTGSGAPGENKPPEQKKPRLPFMIPGSTGHYKD
jgi:hypothetical protein